jgi:hypothetical protein
MKSNCESCGILLGIINLVIFMVLLSEVIIPNSSFGDYTQTECFIGRVDYPVTIPTENNTDDWRHCDCGPKCSAWSPCIGLYSDDKIVTYDFYDKITNNNCTFHNRSCPDGENVINLNNYLENAQNIANTYLNQNVTCYTGDGAIYLIKEFNYETTIGLSVIFVLLCILIYFSFQ